MSRKFVRLLYRPHLLAFPASSSNSENSLFFFSPGHFVPGSSGFVEEVDISLIYFISEMVCLRCMMHQVALLNDTVLPSGSLQEGAL